MNADERDYLSEESRRRLVEGMRRPTLDFLITTLRIANSADELEYVGRLLIAEAWNMRQRGGVRGKGGERREDTT